MFARLTSLQMLLSVDPSILCISVLYLFSAQQNYIMTSLIKVINKIHASCLADRSCTAESRDYARRVVVVKKKKKKVWGTHVQVPMDESSAGLEDTRASKFKTACM